MTSPLFSVELYHGKSLVKSIDNLTFPAICDMCENMPYVEGKYKVVIKESGKIFFEFPSNKTALQCAVSPNS